MHAQTKTKRMPISRRQDVEAADRKTIICHEIILSISSDTMGVTRDAKFQVNDKIINLENSYRGISLIYLEKAVRCKGLFLFILSFIHSLLYLTFNTLLGTVVTKYKTNEILLPSVELKI